MRKNKSDRLKKKETKELLSKGKHITKSEIAFELRQKGIETNERDIRDTISKLAQSLPILCLSNNLKGGYVIVNEEFIKNEKQTKEMVEHQINELKSRIKVLKKRTKPLEKLLKKLQERE